MALRRTGLDDLPLFCVLGLSTGLVLWAGFGSERTARAAGSSAGSSSISVDRALFESSAAVPSDAQVWREAARRLVERVLTEDANTVGALDERSGPAHAEAPDALRLRDFSCNDGAGNPFAVGKLLEDQPHGRWSLWHANGKRMFLGQFDRGEPAGPWSWWFESGALYVEGQFENGLAAGAWREWYPNGQIASTLSYENGVPDGAAHENWPDGSGKSDGDYADGERAGLWEAWYENGQLRARGAYVLGLREGPWSEWHDNSFVMLEASYHRGRPEGLWRESYRNGQIKSTGLFVDGKREGTWVFLGFDGAADPRSGEYERGHKLRP